MLVMSETGFDYDYIFFILLMDMNVDVLLNNKHTYNVVLKGIGKAKPHF